MTMNKHDCKAIQRAIDEADLDARLTVEETFPVIPKVRIAVFADAGVVNSAAYDFTTGVIASDVGIGVRLDLPIGPLRIDYGIPVTGSQFSSGGKFNFNVGYQF